jgi:hypothetical protein
MIGALAGRELVGEELGEAMRVARGRVWKAGGAPPAVAAAQTGKNSTNNEEQEQGRVWRLGLDIDGALIVCQNDDRDGLRQAAATYKRTFGTYPLLAYLDRGDGLREALAVLHRTWECRVKLNRPGFCGGFGPWINKPALQPLV